MEDDDRNMFGTDTAAVTKPSRTDDAWNAADSEEIADAAIGDHDCAVFYDLTAPEFSSHPALPQDRGQPPHAAPVLEADAQVDLDVGRALQQATVQATPAEDIDAFWLVEQATMAMSRSAGADASGLPPQDVARAVVLALTSARGADDIVVQGELFDVVGDFEAVAVILQHRALLVDKADYIIQQLSGLDERTPQEPVAGGAVQRGFAKVDDRSSFRIQTKSDAKAMKFLRKEQRRMQRQVGSDITSASKSRSDVKSTTVAPPREVLQTRQQLAGSAVERMEEAVEELRRSSGIGRATLSNDRTALPKGSERKVFKGYEEVNVPASTRAAVDLSTVKNLIDVKDVMDEFAQQAMKGVEKLNRIQSAVFETAYKTNENMLVCAPTGAGKTNVALLTVLHEVQSNRADATGILDKDAFKIIYVAPMKALAAEVVDKFGKRLAPLGIQVRELTGDMQLTRKESIETQVIVVTPEKWDVITRKAVSGSGNPITEKVKLLIIDEVHLLHDDRGAVLESLVARTVRTVEAQQSMIRLVGLSATLPNYQDVANFLRVNINRGLFFFDASYRPVPLAQSFIGVSIQDRKKRAEQSLKLCYEKVSKSMREGNQVMVFVHTRKGTGRTARELLQASAEDEHAVPLFAPGPTVGKTPSEGPRKKFYEEDPSVVPKIPDWATREIAKSRSADIRELSMRGIGIHHAGLLRPDRKLVEKLFAEGVIRCLVCTSTLAWGVNLPAHTVVIYGTELYDPKRGGFVDLGMLDVMQIFGRAGRPQFDVEGEGIIITTHAKLSHYLRLLTSTLPIESQMNKGSSLIDHLNAEIVLGSISNVKEGAEWLSYTYLSVRMRENPLAYGLHWAEVQSDPYLATRKAEMVVSASKALDEARMVRFDPKSGTVGPTDLGRVASHFYVSHGTIVEWNEKLKADMDESELLSALSSATEFDELKVREEEVEEIAALKRLACPFKVLGGFDNTAGKVNVLLQAFVSKAPIKNFTLISDSMFVQQNAARLMQAIFEIALKKGWPSLSSRALDFCKALDNQVWAFQHPLRQLPRLLQLEVSARLENSGSTGEIDNLRSMTHGEITSLVRSPKVASSVMNAVSAIPMVSVTARVAPLTRTVLRIDVELTPQFNWIDVVLGSSAGATETFYLWIEDYEQARIYHAERILISRKESRETKKLVVLVPIFDPPSPQYAVRVLASKWHGGDSYTELSLRGMIFPDKHPPHTQLLDLRPLPREALEDGRVEQLYKFSHFNPIQTQVFHTLYHTHGNVLVGAPTGSGKTVIAELAMLRCFRETPRSVVVYIGPLKALVRERVLDWRQRVIGLLGKRMVELTGDVTPNASLLRSADLICTTPEKWDGVSRDWKQREYVRRVGLIILDEVHLLGGDRGPVLEVLVSRTRRTNPSCRLVALSTALANAHELGDWLAVDPRDGLYNFRPSVRPVPCEAHVIGVAGEHYCPRMNAMNRPAYQAILRYSPAKPVLIFVSSRRQTRLTALEIIRLAAAEGDPRKFSSGSAEEYEDAGIRISDPAFKQTVDYGVGIHHAGMSDADRSLAEQLFLSGKLQILVSTSTLAWGVNLPAHLVIVKGTEYFDSDKQKYVEMPITDILQMMGRAGRPQFDNRAFAVILVQDSKKSFYKKFLYDPFPVESSLHEQLHDHVNAEIASGTIRSAQDAIDYLTWTYLFRRLVTNPSYYGLDDTSAEGVSAFASRLIEKVLLDLHQFGCISIRQEDMDIATIESVEQSRVVEPSTKKESSKVVGALSSEKSKAMQIRPTFLGKVAADYYISHRTVHLFQEQLKPQMSAEMLVRVLTDSGEFAGIPVRHNEDKHNEILSCSLVKYIKDEVRSDTDKEIVRKFGLFRDQMGSPHVKARLLLLTHFSRLELPVADYATDLRSVLDNCARVLQALIDIAAEKGFWGTTKAGIQLSQMLTQGLWHSDSALRCLPGWTKNLECKLRSNGIGSIAQLTRAREPVLERVALGDAALRGKLSEAISRLPAVRIGRSGVTPVNTREFEESIWNIGVARAWQVDVTVHRDGSGSGRDRKGDRKLEVVSSSEFTKRGLRHGWFIAAVAPATNTLLALKRIGGFEKSVQAKLAVEESAVGDMATVEVWLLSDSYIGLQSHVTLSLHSSSSNGTNPETGSSAQGRPRDTISRRKESATNPGDTHRPSGTPPLARPGPRKPSQEK